jgi:hypothetical protein
VRRDLLTTTSNGGETVLHLAARSGSLEVAVAARYIDLDPQRQLTLLLRSFWFFYLKGHKEITKLWRSRASYFIAMIGI